MMSDIFMMFSLSIFSFVVFAFCGLFLFLISKKLLPNPKSQRFMPLYSPKNSALTQVFDPLWVDFYIRGEVGVQLTLLCVGSSCLSTICRKDCFLPHWMILSPLSKTSWPKMYGLISRLSPVPYCLDYCNFGVDPEIGKYVSSDYSFFQDCFGYSRSFATPYEF